MIALFASVLALAGAPVGTPVTCYPDVPVPGSWGVAYPAYGSLVWGPPHISIYGPLGCAAAFYLAASPRQRLAILSLNPRDDWALVVGVGLAIDLHEAEHIALNDASECIVETAAMKKLPSLLASFPPAFRKTALEEATARHDTLPESYLSC